MRNSTRISCVVVDTSQSPSARLKPAPLPAVELTDSFWAPRLKVNREVTLPSQYRLLEETGRIDNFRRAAAENDQPFRGWFFNDSDAYKWLEAAAWTLARDDDASIARMAEDLIADIAAAQQPDGYLNTYFMFDRAAERWTNLRDMHELYCAGHLIQAAVAYTRASGRDSLLKVARRLADHICTVFGSPEEGKRSGTPGHEEIEMALVELARETGASKYYKQAKFFLDMRGRGLVGGGPYHQDHRPFRELERIAGHAVRAVYLNAGATDLYAESGEPALREALDRLWQNMTTRQMYISGGIGPHHRGEAFGKDFELPNERAYAETCAAIGSIMWSWRMLGLDGDARYADVMELVLYNGFLAGISLDGRSYFYQNPLADDGTHRRQSWFECACCPPNIARLLASIPGYFYSLSGEGIWVHLYAQGTADLTHNGRDLSLFQESRYPWDGEITIKVEGSGEFSLFLRIPAWCQAGSALFVNGQPYTRELVPGTYARIHRDWRQGDTVRVQLPMPVRLIECHPYVQENTCHTAVMRGPLLYCLEQVDNPGVELRDILLPANVRFSSEFEDGLLGGVVVLRAQAHTVPLDEGWDNHLYRTLSPAPRDSRSQTVEIAAIPYHAWANRDPGPMRVWLRTDWVDG